MKSEWPRKILGFYTLLGDRKLVTKEYIGTYYPYWLDKNIITFYF